MRAGRLQQRVERAELVSATREMWWRGRQLSRSHVASHGGQLCASGMRSGVTLVPQGQIEYLWSQMDRGTL
ncbi:hypothetical protein Rhe02_84030 [Rhizocola hellebori]|uniref:Uncharacterized protein n=1 Tax=Rhizocola hellebori TaxID=1392758 RepID=A0A8J3QGT8_9ACTN|nr:hypothetical protein Rhe02_84030 [Rhizocola hellebori]